MNTNVSGWELTFVDVDAFNVAKLPVANWKPAHVPGCVQTSAFGLPVSELYKKTNVTQVRWMEEKLWLFRTTLKVPAVAADETVELEFAGLDYRYQIFLHGRKVADGEGMFSPVTLPLNDFAGKSVDLLVALYPPPTAPGEGWVATGKAKFGKGWDFAPTVPTIGIWDEVRIRVLPRLRITDAFVETKLHNTQRALVTVRASFSEMIESGVVTIELHGVRRKVPVLYADHLTMLIEVLSPQLWWPNGLGEAVLHDLTITLEVTDRKTTPFVRRVGLRELARVPAQGQRAEDIPLQFVVNGVPFFINGVNWVPPDSCIGDISDEHYERFLPRFRDGHVNVVRVWGGGICEKRRFYDRCDELGLFVFQEFPIACGLGMSRDIKYLRLLRRECVAIARKLREHPSVFCFSGGNENYHYWDVLDSDDPVLHRAGELIKQQLGADKQFNREWQLGADRYDEPAHIVMGGVAAEHAPGVLYQNTSAMEREGEVHGIWTWNPTIGDHRYRGFKTLYDYWIAADQNLYSEASVNSIANLETIHDVLDDRAFDGIPNVDDETWNMHHAFRGAWDKYEHLWLDIPSTEAVFGPIKTLRELVKANQYLQSEGARFMIEELRRKQPRATGVIWWGVNEPWPGLAGNALIDYFGRRKAAWQYVKNAFAPTILTLSYKALQPKKLNGEIWLCHNDRAPFQGRYDLTITDGGSLNERYEGRCAAEYGQSVPLRRILPTQIPADGFVTVTARLYRDSDNSPVHENVYHFGNLRKVVLA